MNVKSLINLKWKSTFRHPLFKQSLIFTILLSVYWCFCLYFLIKFGLIFEKIVPVYLKETIPVNIILLTVIPLFLFDFILKLFLKGNGFPFGCYFRFPRSNKKLFTFFLFEELFTFWNVYILIFFSPFILLKVYPLNGFLLTLLLFVNLWAIQILVTQFVSLISLSKTKITYFVIIFLIIIFTLPSIQHLQTVKLGNITAWSIAAVFVGLLNIIFFLAKISLKRIKYSNDGHSVELSTGFLFSLKTPSLGALGDYLFLGIKMIWRSPRLRYQLVIYLLITAIYICILNNKEGLLDSFSTKLVFTCLIFVLYPLVFNQYIFSAEASFFDKLMLTPNFGTYLKSKYIQSLLFSLISFVIYIFSIHVQLFTIFQIICILLYSTGTVTLLSFTSTLFANSNYDLFGAYYKTWTNPPSGQILAVILAYVVPIAVVIALNHLFSERTANYFMLTCGIISISFSNQWLSFLFKCFRSKRYSKMEVFRALN